MPKVDPRFWVSYLHKRIQLPEGVDFGHISVGRLHHYTRETLPKDLLGACWTWTGNSKLLVVLPDDDKQTRLNNYLYELTHGPIPPNARLRSKCRSKTCINPWHWTCPKAPATPTQPLNAFKKLSEEDIDFRGLCNWIQRTIPHVDTFADLQKLALNYEYTDDELRNALAHLNITL